MIPNAKRSLMRKDDDLWKIYCHQPAVNGKANQAVITIIADNFKVKKTQIEIIKGLKSSYKTISIKGI